MIIREINETLRKSIEGFGKQLKREKQQKQIKDDETVVSDKPRHLLTSGGLWSR